METINKVILPQIEQSNNQSRHQSPMLPSCALPLSSHGLARPWMLKAPSVLQLSSAGQAKPWLWKAQKLPSPRKLLRDLKPRRPIVSRDPNVPPSWLGRPAQSKRNYSTSSDSEETLSPTAYEQPTKLTGFSVLGATAIGLGAAGVVLFKDIPTEPLVDIIKHFFSL